MNLTNITNAYEHIAINSHKRLKQLYPHGIPKLIEVRYDKELSYLRDSEYINDFEIYRLLSEEAQKCSQYFTLRGTIAGSLLVYLLGYGRFNPLPAHYYCTKCGHFETVNTRLYGIDLPEKPCPECGRSMKGDGFNLSIESVWGPDGKRFIDFNYNVSSEFLPFAKNILAKAYRRSQIVPYGVLTSFSDDNPLDNVEVVHSGFVVLPVGALMEDYPEITTYLEDGEPCLTGHSFGFENPDLKLIKLCPAKQLEHLIELQRKTGIYAYEINNANLRDITCYDVINSRTLTAYTEEFFSNERPKTFSEVVSYGTIGHNSFTDIEHNDSNRCRQIKKQILDSPEFQNYPCFTREDFFDYLVKRGLSTDEAYRLSEMIRKGMTYKFTNSDVVLMPEDLFKVAQKYLYVFPRAHSVEDMLLKAKLAYYMKQDSRIYSRVVFKKK